MSATGLSATTDMAELIGDGESERRGDGEKRGRGSSSPRLRLSLSPRPAFVNTSSLAQFLVEPPAWAFEVFAVRFPELVGLSLARFPGLV